MKKIITLALTLAMLLLSAFPLSAAECAHEYTESAVEATCIERAHKLFCCKLCSESYKIYDDSPILPASFYVLAKSERDGDTLRVSVEINNNPGLMASRLFVSYNSAALSAEAVQLGEVWVGSSYPLNVNLENNPFTVYSEILGGHNYKNGELFSVSFKVIDENEDYGIELYYNVGDFADWDDSTNTLLKHTPEIFNTVGKSELAPCDYQSEIIAPDCTNEGYTLHTCKTCSDSYKTDTVSSLGHDWTLTETVSAPDFDNTGSGLFFCERCSLEELLEIPVLEHYMKGDINNDGLISPKDVNLALRIVSGALYSLQMNDSADMNSDGDANAKDINILISTVSGG